jgi:hypothetical protein
MKVAVLYNNSGEIICMQHYGHADQSNERAVKQRMLPREGQLLQEMEVPQQHMHLKPIELHKAVMVDITQSPHRLITKS